MLVHWYKRDVASAFVMLSQGFQDVSWAVGLEGRQWVVRFEVLLWVMGLVPVLVVFIGGRGCGENNEKCKSSHAC
jgi:hypothetical protein